MVRWPDLDPNPSGLQIPAKVAVIACHEHQIARGNLGQADHGRRHPRQERPEAAQEADRAEAEAWSIRMEGYGGPAQPSPTIGQCLNGGLGWLEVECNRCTRAAEQIAREKRHGANSLTASKGG